MAKSHTRTYRLRLAPSIAGYSVPGVTSGNQVLTHHDLPVPVRAYLGLSPTGVLLGDRFHNDLPTLKRKTVVQEHEPPAEPVTVPGEVWVCRVERHRNGTPRAWHVRWNLPVQERAPRVRRGSPAIRSMADLCRYFGAETPAQLNHILYKQTQCGAHLSLCLPSGWLHDGRPGWDRVTLADELVAFLIGTIVEGSDAAPTKCFPVPTPVAEVEQWLAEMEAQAEEAWHEANDPEPEAQEETHGRRD